MFQTRFTWRASIVNTDSLQAQGSVVVGIDTQIFLSVLFPANESYGSLLVANNQGQIIFGNTDEPVSIDELWLLKSRNTRSPPSLRFKTGSSCSGAMTPATGNGSSFFYLLSAQDLSRQTSETIALIFMVCAAFILLSVICMSGIVHNLTQGIRRLITHLKLVRHGGWGGHCAAFYPNDEIGEITLAFNEMVGDLHKLVEQVAEQKLLAERAQYRALQAEFQNCRPCSIPILSTMQWKP